MNTITIETTTTDIDVTIGNNINAKKEDSDDENCSNYDEHDSDEKLDILDIVPTAAGIRKTQDLVLETKRKKSPTVQTTLEQAWQEMKRLKAIKPQQFDTPEAKLTYEMELLALELKLKEEKIHKVDDLHFKLSMYTAWTFGIFFGEFFVRLVVLACVFACFVRYYWCNVLDLNATPAQTKWILKRQLDMYNDDMLKTIEYDANGNAKLKILFCSICSCDPEPTEHRGWHNCIIVWNNIVKFRQKWNEIKSGCFQHPSSATHTMNTAIDKGTTTRNEIILERMFRTCIDMIDTDRSGSQWTGEIAKLIEMKISMGNRYHSRGGFAKIAKFIANKIVQFFAKDILLTPLKATGEYPNFGITKDKTSKYSKNFDTTTVKFNYEGVYEAVIVALFEIRYDPKQPISFGDAGSQARQTQYILMQELELKLNHIRQHFTSQSYDNAVFDHKVDIITQKLLQLPEFHQAFRDPNHNFSRTISDLLTNQLHFDTHISLGKDIYNSYKNADKQIKQMKQESQVSMVKFKTHSTTKFGDHMHKVFESQERNYHGLHKHVSQKADKLTTKDGRMNKQLLDKIESLSYVIPNKFYKDLLHDHKLLLKMNQTVRHLSYHIFDEISNVNEKIEATLDLLRVDVGQLFNNYDGKWIQPQMLEFWPSLRDIIPKYDEHSNIIELKAVFYGSDQQYSLQATSYTKNSKIFCGWCTYSNYEQAMVLCNLCKYWYHFIDGCEKGKHYRNKTVDDFKNDIPKDVNNEVKSSNYGYSRKQRIQTKLNNRDNSNNNNDNKTNKKKPTTIFYCNKNNCYNNHRRNSPYTESETGKYNIDTGDFDDVLNQIKLGLLKVLELLKISFEDRMIHPPLLSAMHESLSLYNFDKKINNILKYNSLKNSYDIDMIAKFNIIDVIGDICFEYQLNFFDDGNTIENLLCSMDIESIKHYKIIN